MSTQINVTVGPLTLVEQSRQQMEANRFRQSEQEAQLRTLAAADAAIKAARELQGLGPDGLPQYAPWELPQFRRDRPAAFRVQQGTPSANAGVLFAGVSWNANILTLTVRISPTGVAPDAALGALFVSIASTSVVAILPDGTPASSQPANLPSVVFSGKVADPFEGTPTPDQVFQAQFQIPYPATAFPPEAEDPAQQLTYRATVEFTAYIGGFNELAFLDTATVDFVTTNVPTAGVVFDWYLVEYAWEGGTDLETRTSVITPGVLRAEDIGFYSGWEAGKYQMKAELLNPDGEPVVQYAGDEVGVGPEVQHDLITTASLPAVTLVQFRLAAYWWRAAFGSIQVRIYGYKGGSFTLDEENFVWVNESAETVELLALKQVVLPTTTYESDEETDGGRDFIGYDVATLTINLENGTASLGLPCTYYESSTIWVVLQDGVNTNGVTDEIKIGPVSGNPGFYVCADEIKLFNNTVVYTRPEYMTGGWIISTTDPSP